MPLAPFLLRAAAALAALVAVPRQTREERLVEIGHLHGLDGHAHPASDHLLRQRLARVERHRRLARRAGLSARLAAGLAGRQYQPHLRRVVREVLAQFLDVRARDLAAAAHQLHRHPQVRDAPALARQVERPFLAALRHPHVAHPHLLEKRGAEVLERAGVQLGEPAPQRADHRAAHLCAELRGTHRPRPELRRLGLLQRSGGRRELDQRHALAVHDEGRLAPGLRAPAVVLEQRGHQRGQVADQSLREKLPPQQVGRQIAQRRAALALRERFEDHLRGGRKTALPLAPLVLAAPLGLGLLVPLLVLRLQLGEPAAGLRVDRARLALPRPVERLAGVGGLHRRRDRVDLDLLRDRPLEQGEGPLRQDRHHHAVVLALRHRGEALAHGDLGILAHVREQVVPQRGLGDVLEVEGLSSAPQDLHGRLGERHVTLRGVRSGPDGGYPSAAPEKYSQPIELHGWCQRT